MFLAYDEDEIAYFTVRWKTRASFVYRLQRKREGVMDDDSGDDEGVEGEEDWLRQR